MHSILTLNGGSSSIKFAWYLTGELLKRGLYGKIDRIGLNGMNLTIHDPDGKPRANHKLDVSNHKSAADFLIDWLEKQNGFESFRAVGHRAVHGMKHTAPATGDRTPHDADSRYDKLEHVVMPLHYQNRAGWLDVMRHAIALNGSFFNTQRMLLAYVLKAYFE